MGKKQGFYQKRGQRQILSSPLSSSWVAACEQQHCLHSYPEEKPRCYQPADQCCRTFHFPAPKPTSFTCAPSKIMVYFFFFNGEKEKKKKFCKGPQCCSRSGQPCHRSSASAGSVFTWTGRGRCSGNDLCASGNRWARKKHGWFSKRVFSCWWQGMYYIVWLLQTRI